MSNSFFKTIHPYIIAGPCSIESKEQLWQTAFELKKSNIQMLRGGVWKPRTRPGSFEGMGEIALKWLKELRAELDLPICIEVAETKHVELALKYNIDCLWIGARTSVNPFQVQHIAQALKGCDIPIMVKNPVNPDVDLWQGALERFINIGLKNIAAIHRGFSTYKMTKSYRNVPNWIIPVELQRRMPDLPIICDPSHIAGKADLVTQVAQKAMSIGFDGLMIESHINPKEAWTDAVQQLTPHQLFNLINKLQVRHANNDSENIDIEYLRQNIDTIDAEIIELLARRMEQSEKLGAIKKINKLSIYQPERWREIINSRNEQGLKHNLEKAYIDALWQIIHDESIKKQLEISENKI